MIWDLLEESQEKAREEVGPIAKLQTMWRAVPAPGADELEIRDGCEAMRDFVVKLRAHTAMEFAAPVMKGLTAYSQPLMNYKYRQFNTHRRDFDRKALRAASDPAPVAPAIPRMPGPVRNRPAATLRSC